MCSASPYSLLAALWGCLIKQNCRCSTRCLPRYLGLKRKRGNSIGAVLPYQKQGRAGVAAAGGNTTAETPGDGITAMLCNPGTWQARARALESQPPWNTQVPFAPEQVIYLTAVINRDLEMVHWVKHAGYSWRQPSLLPDMPASTHPAAFRVGDGAHIAPPQAETHPSWALLSTLWVVQK